jgi:hypothetical protein
VAFPLKGIVSGGSTFEGIASVAFPLMGIIPGGVSLKGIVAGVVFLKNCFYGFS